MNPYEGGGVEMMTVFIFISICSFLTFRKIVCEIWHSGRSGCGCFLSAEDISDNLLSALLL